MLPEHLRKSDISCRYGGDEFVLVLPDSSIADTQERVEQIRIFIHLRSQAPSLTSPKWGRTILPDRRMRSGSIVSRMSV